MNAREVRLELPGRPYSIWVGPGILDAAHEFVPPLPGAELIALFTDASVGGLHGPRATAALARLGLRVETFTVEPGEESKSLGTAEAALRWLAGAGAHRTDLAVAFGGGVVGDLAGFVAATYHRGMPFAQIPTTLLAQVDASIGGKTGVDLPEGKNLVGSFHQPVTVIADTELLVTLPQPAFATGMAEVIKHALIAPGELLSRLHVRSEQILDRDLDELTGLVADAARVKVDVVASDETEQGTRAFLNYGHTLGHALEALGEYRRFTHGEAVAIGMMFAAALGAEVGHKDLIDQHRDLVDAFGLPSTGAGFEYEQVEAMWRRDKKYQAGVRFVVLEDLGKPALVSDVPDRALRAAYEAVR